MAGIRSRAFLTEPAQDPTFKFISDLAKELSSGRVELPSFPDAAARVQQVLSDPAVPTSGFHASSGPMPAWRRVC